MLASSSVHAKPVATLLDNNPASPSADLSAAPSSLANFLPSGPCDLPLTLPYFENFEGMSVPGLPTCWTPLSGSWALSNASSFTDLHPLSGTKYLSTTGIGGANIWSPGLSLQASTSYDFAFWHATNGYITPYPPGMMEVELYVNTTPNSTGAVLLGVLSQVELTESNFTELRKSFVPTASGTYYFGLHALSAAGHIAFDDFSVSPTVACSRPTALTAAGITDSSVDLSWVASTSNPANGYQWEARTSGAPGTGATGLFASGVLPAGTTSVTLGSLQSDTQYAIYVRGDCSGVLSPWAGSVEITTHCEPVDLPYLQNFSSSSPSGLPACMRRQNFGINSWSVNMDQGSMFFKSGQAPQHTWMFTNGLNLTAGHSYQLQYAAMGGSSTMLKMVVAIGTDATESGMTTVLHDHTSSPTSVQTFTWNFTAITSGVHYIGFNAYGGEPLYTWVVDDISFVDNTSFCELQGALPYLEDFENDAAPAIPLCMTNETITGYPWKTMWDSGPPIPIGLDGIRAVLPGFGPPIDPPADSWLFLPRMELTAGTNYRLSYDYGNAFSGSPTLNVMYGMAPSATAMTTPLALHSIITSNYLSHVVDFTPSTTGTYYIGFHGYSSSSFEFLGLDNISVVEIPPYPAPEDLAAPVLQQSQAGLTWTLPGGLPTNGFQWEVRTNGLPGSGNTGLGASGSTPSLGATAFGLLPSTTYSLYVRSDWGGGIFSAWAGPQTFTTLACSGNTVVVAITTDAFPQQISWEITDESDAVIATGGPTAAQANMLVSEAVCVGTTPGNACYGFRLMDSFGDGMLLGYWQLKTTTGKVLLGDVFAGGFNSPSATPLNPNYTQHNFCLPSGPANIASTECGIFDNLLGNKVYCNKVTGASNYQFEFSDPDAGFIRRIARPYNYVHFWDMVSTPLIPGVTYFARVRTDRDGPMATAHFGSGCEMGLGQVVICTQLIQAPAYGHSCNETRTFNTSANNSFIYAKPVVGATEYQFRITNTQEGYDQTFTRNTYILQLKWNSTVAPALTNGYTYQVSMNVKVNGVYSGFCTSLCNITIDNGGNRPEASMVQAMGTATLWPNPVRDGQVNLNIDGLVDAEQTISVDIQDVYGKQVFAKEFGNSGDRFSTMLNLSGEIASGVYLVNLTVNGERTVQRLSIMR